MRKEEYPDQKFYSEDGCSRFIRNSIYHTTKRRIQRYKNIPNFLCVRVCNYQSNFMEQGSF
jgi:hypothetical protein